MAARRTQAPSGAAHWATVPSPSRCAAPKRGWFAFAVHIPAAHAGGLQIFRSCRSEQRCSRPAGLLPVAMLSGQVERFSSAKALANYSLPVPRAHNTGKALPADRTPLGRHLGQRGNRTLKWAFIEADAIRHGRPSALRGKCDVRKQLNVLVRSVVLANLGVYDGREAIT